MLPLEGRPRLGAHDPTRRGRHEARGTEGGRDGGLPRDRPRDRDRAGRGGRGRRRQLRVERGGGRRPSCARSRSGAAARLAVRADVSDFPDTFRMAQDVLAAFGHVDILVNNAGINSDKTFVKMDHAAWRKVLAINLDGVFNCTKVFVDDMLKRSFGRIVNITSVIGQIGNFGQANYAASKAGVTAMTKSLAKELASKGITVNAAGARVRRDGDGGLHPREGPPASARPDPAQALRKGRGGGPGGDLPRLVGRRLHHRRGALPERRAPDAARARPLRGGRDRAP